MPRSQKVPAYSLHKPSGRAYVRLNNGGKRRTIYLGEHGSDQSRENYARVIADLLAGRPVRQPSQERGNPPPPAPALAIQKLVERFEKHAAGYYVKNGKPTSEVAAIRCALKFLAADHSELPAAEFTIGDLKAVRQAMIDAGHRRGTINKNIRRIRLAFRWAATEELVPGEVARDLALLPGLKMGRSDAKESDPVRPVDDHLVQKTLRELSPTVRAMVELQQTTGMRPDEVCQVRPMDVDRTNDVWIYQPQTHKTEHAGRSRLIPLGKRAQAILTPFLLRPGTEYCFRPDIHVAVPRANKRYRVDSYRKAVIRAADRAFPSPKGAEGEALKAWRKKHRFFPNQLRHSFATKAREACGLEAVQALLGHARADVTQVYAESSMARAIEAARAIG